MGCELEAQADDSAELSVEHSFVSQEDSFAAALEREYGFDASRDSFNHTPDLGVPEVAVEEETDRSLSIPTTPTRISSVTDGLLAITPKDDLASPRDEASDQYFSPVDILQSPLAVPSPGGSIQILSPSPHRPLAAPSVPTTPSREALGYNSDESEEWRPRTRPLSTKKRIVFDSDDDEPGRGPAVYAVEDSPELVKRAVIVDDSDDEVRRPKPKGLRGRTPAALRFLEESEDDEEEGEDYDEEDTAGSLADFIVEDDGEDLEFVVDDSEEGGFDNNPAFSDEDDELDDTDDEEFHDAPVSPVKRSPVKRPGPSIIDLLDSSDDEDLPAPRFRKLSISSPRIKTQASLATSKSKRAWEVQRAQIAQDVFDDLDAAVFEGRLGAGGANAKLEWGSRILRSAGNARMSRWVGDEVDS